VCNTVILAYSSKLVWPAEPILPVAFGYFASAVFFKNDFGGNLYTFYLPLPEPLADAHGTLRFHRTPVEKHCSLVLTHFRLFQMQIFLTVKFDLFHVEPYVGLVTNSLYGLNKVMHTKINCRIKTKISLSLQHQNKAILSQCEQ